MIAPCMSSSSPPTSPSHRSPLTLLSKLKRQLSKSPVTQHQKQPIEHQYLPIPTVSFSESLHSNQALSTYSCSNNSSSCSSFLFIDHDEQPASFGVDEYRPFLPLVIQHERLQQQQRLAHPRPAPTTAPRARILPPPPPSEPPSPTSTASSRSPITPIFPASFFNDVDDDDIMTMTNSEVGSISEYSLPRSLSAYMDEARNARSRKSHCQTSSDSDSRHRRSRGMSVRTPPPRITSRKSFPPISPPPSCPLPEPPVSVEPASTAIRPRTPLVTSDGEFSSSDARSLRNESTATPILVPASLSPADCLDPRTKAKPRPESTATILSDLEIFDSPTYAFITTTSTSDEPSDNQKEDDDDDASPSNSTHTSVSTPTTPRQYGIGRQVLRGSGSGRDFDFIGSSSKRLSASSKRNSTGIEKKENRLSVGPESSSKAENIENEEQLDKPSVADEGSSEVNQEHPTQSQTRTQVPSPSPPRRRVKSDDTNPNAGANISRRSTYHEKYRERSHPEWTLFLGIPRNATPPQPPPSSVLFSTGEPNGIPHLASTPSRAKAHRHSLLTTHHLLAPTMTMRNRTKSDSALLATASALAPGGAAEELRDVTTKTKRGEEDWTLSLPLVVSPTTPSSASSAEGSNQHSDAPSGSQPVVEEPIVEEVDATAQDLVITVEDVDKGKQKHRQGQVPIRRFEEEEQRQQDDQDPLIFRVPRIVRSCSSYPVLSTTTSTSPTHNIHSRLKKSSSTMWMEMEASTSNLRREVSSCTLEQEVMSMLLGDSAEEDEESQSLKSRSSSSSLSTTTKKKEIAKKKMATLDEDLARFNALLKNGNLSGTGNRPVSSIIESAMAAAASAIANNPRTTTTTKTKAVTLNSHPDPTPTTTNTSPASLRKRKKSTTSLPTILKPVLKHVKSCEPFLHLDKSSSSDSSGVHSSPSKMRPVMRFPSSVGRRNLTFFDELGRGRHGHGEPSRANLRMTKSAEWVMGDDDDDAPPPPIPTTATITTTTKSRPTSTSSRASQQQQRTTSMSRHMSSSRASQQQRQQRTTSIPRPISSSSLASQQQQRTTPMSRPTSSSSLASQQQQQRTTSRSNSPLSTSSTQTSLLLPIGHYNTKFASSSSSSSSSTTTTATSTASNKKSKGSLGRFEMSGSSRGVPFRAVSMGSLTTHFESTSDSSSSQAEKQQHHHGRRKRSPPLHLPLHTSSNSSSSSASTLTSASPPQQPQISVSSIDNNDADIKESRRRSISPPPPPSPIASESSSTLPTPLASAFPLPPSSPSISISELDGVVAIQQKLREFENERERLQQEQQQQQLRRGKEQYQFYRPPSTASSFRSLASTASSTATVVPSSDQKMRMRSMSMTGGGSGVGQEREAEAEADFQDEEDEDSMCSSVYYTARSSFSQNGS